METERKFLVDCLPDLSKYSFKELEQGYLSFEPEIRIRSMNNVEFYLAQKTNGDLSRGEVEPSIDEVTFQILTNLIKGRVITKTRYYIPISDKLIAELDLYHGELDGLVTVETEFKSEDDATLFVAPSWYGRDITYDKRYKNKNLARCSAEDLKMLLDDSGVKRIRK